MKHKLSYIPAIMPTASGKNVSPARSSQKFIHREALFIQFRAFLLEG